MARQNMRPIPYLKNMEAYNDFSGGLNTITSDDNLKDNEFNDLLNVDLDERGSVKRRNGWSRHLTPAVQGAAQGYFRFFKADGTMEEIIATGGKLYKNGVVIPIPGLTTFQTSRQIEAVQFKNKLYIATGSKLVVYDGTTASIVTPYKPEPLEAIYIGTNSLADDPNNYLADGISAVLQINGMQPDLRYGIANKDAFFTVYVSKPAGTTIEYKLEWRLYDGGTWTIAQDWGTSNRLKLKNPTARDYQLRFVIRQQGTTPEVEAMLPRYSVKATNENKVVDTSSVHQCNRILVHWERVILYGDPKQKDLIYVSDIDRPEYVPTTHTLRFENQEQEELTALVKFRDMLIAFTPHTIQGLYGKGPEDFSRMYLSTSIGCIAPYSAKVFENYIGFLSLEGIYILKSVGYSENRINVEKIDSVISNSVPRDRDACAIVSDGQYQLIFPTKNIRFRFYYQRAVWTKDESPKLNFNRMYEFDGIAYGQASPSSIILKADKTKWDDDGYVYKDRYVFKEYDFNEPYNPKKLKELQILLAQTANTKLSIWVYADGAAIISPDNSYASVNELGNVVWNDSTIPNIHIETGTVLGSWIMGKSTFGNTESGVQKMKLAGKCRKVRIEIEHAEATPNTVLGLGFIFKSKKP